MTANNHQEPHDNQPGNAHFPSVPVVVSRLTWQITLELYPAQEYKSDHQMIGSIEVFAWRYVLTVIYRQIEVGQFLPLFKSLKVNFKAFKKILLTCFCFRYSSQAAARGQGKVGCGRWGGKNISEGECAVTCLSVTYMVCYIQDDTIARLKFKTVGTGTISYL